jgi:predicted transposase/invertase (TIGR01784 family)
MEKESKIHHFKDIELHTIELGKFENINETNQSRILNKAEELKLLLPRIKTSLDRWAAFLTRHDLLDIKKLPKELDDPKVQKALDVLEEMNFTKKEREAYEDHLKWLRVEYNTLKTAESKGFEQGKAEGKAEVIKQMLANNIDMNHISKITGLSVEEINKLIGEFNGKSNKN